MCGGLLLVNCFLWSIYCRSRSPGCGVFVSFTVMNLVLGLLPQNEIQSYPCLPCVSFKLTSFTFFDTVSLFIPPFQFCRHNLLPPSLPPYYYSPSFSASFQSLLLFLSLLAACTPPAPSSPLIPSLPFYPSLPSPFLPSLPPLRDGPASHQVTVGDGPLTLHLSRGRGGDASPVGSRHSKG